MKHKSTNNNAATLPIKHNTTNINHLKVATNLIPPNDTKPKAGRKNKQRLLTASEREHHHEDPPKKSSATNKKVAYI